MRLLLSEMKQVPGRNISVKRQLLFGAATFSAALIVGGCGALANTSSPAPVPTPYGGGSGTIYFLATREGGLDFNVYSMDASCIDQPETCEATVERLTRDFTFARDLTISPDGSQLALWGTHGDDEGEFIYLMDADCANLPQGCDRSITRLPMPGSRVSDWSPDGSQILFEGTYRGEADYITNIYASNVDGADEVRLVELPESREFGAQWSPDGTRILFGSNRNGNLDLFMVDAECASQPEGCESSLIQLTTDEHDDIGGVWSPDGSKIAYASCRKTDAYDIYLMDADCASQPGGCDANQIQLTDTPYEDEGPEWSPDGTKLLFSSNRTGNYEQFVMNTDGSNIIQLTEHEAYDLFAIWQP
jgi:Tol biopolymer transport system component